MPRDPHMVSIPVSLLNDLRVSARDWVTLLHLIALADSSARCNYDEHALTHLLGVTIRTARKWLARLEGFGYIINHSWATTPTSSSRNTPAGSSSSTCLAPSSRDIPTPSGPEGWRMGLRRSGSSFCVPTPAVQPQPA